MDKNLIQRVDRAEAVPRFVMLETIREYALSASSMAETSYCTSRSCSLLPGGRGRRKSGMNSADRSRWLSLCDVEIDNFRFALDWLFQTRDLDWAFRMCVALFRFWDMREHLTEGRGRLETVLRLAGTERTKRKGRGLGFSRSVGDHSGRLSRRPAFLKTKPQSL